jgi:hypothetical protein
MGRSKKGMAKFGIKVDARWDRPPAQESACADKQRLTEGFAETRVHHMEKKHGVPFESYRCRRCESIDEDECYHVGRSSNWDSLEHKYGVRGGRS